MFAITKNFDWMISNLLSRAKIVSRINSGITIDINVENFKYGKVITYFNLKTIKFYF